MRRSRSMMFSTSAFGTVTAIMMRAMADDGNDHVRA
jgi:hypothetical protein